MYPAAVLAVAVACALTFALRPWMGPSVSILFFPAIILVAMNGGYGPALVATILSSASLAFFFIQPYYSFDVGADDVIRLSAFAVVAMVTASISSARKRAEDAQHKTLAELRKALSTVQKVSGWPVFVDVNLAGGASKLLAHAASVVGCDCAVAVWEAEDEPWMYLAGSEEATDTVNKFPPASADMIVPPALQGSTFVSPDVIGGGMRVVVRQGEARTEWHGMPAGPDVAAHLRGTGLASSPFEVERLSGRVFFCGVANPAEDVMPLVEVVAREVGNSLERLHLHDRLQQIAVREDRIRVARDLHDGVLQSLTGIRLRLQVLADAPDAVAATRDRLLATERAIAIEQRELRLFIEDLKPATRPARSEEHVEHALEELRNRLAAEWMTPIAVRVSPQNLSLSAAAGQTLRLIVREAVVNALKHAHPSRVSVDVQAHGTDALRLVISNDGRGFPFRGRLDHAALIAQNAGPVSLRERLASLGGSLAIESLSSGSRVEITLPV
jgi:signal transduction histidine kinase